MLQKVPMSSEITIEESLCLINLFRRPNMGRLDSNFGINRKMYYHEYIRLTGDDLGPWFPVSDLLLRKWISSLPAVQAVIEAWKSPLRNCGVGSLQFLKRWAGPALFVSFLFIHLGTFSSPSSLPGTPPPHLRTNSLTFISFHIKKLTPFPSRK